MFSRQKRSAERPPGATELRLIRRKDPEHETSGRPAVARLASADRTAASAPAGVTRKEVGFVNIGVSLPQPLRTCLASVGEPRAPIDRRAADFVRRGIF